MPVLKIIRGLFLSLGFNFKFKSLLSTAASCCRLQNGMRAARGDAGKTNELVVSLNVFISQPADKQSPGARQPPTSHPYRQLRTLNKEGHFEGGTLQRGGDTSCNTRGDGGHFQWSFTPGWENPYSFQKCSTAEKTHFLCDISNIA